ncbi:hypothetical protein THAOC_24349, partial [Thalassiosira oceanica]
TSTELFDNWHAKRQQRGPRSSTLATRQQRPQRRRISNHAPPIQTSGRSRNHARERSTAQTKQATLRQGHPRGGRGRLPAEPTTTATIDGNHTSTDDRTGSHKHTPAEGYGTYEQFRPERIRPLRALVETDGHTTPATG